MQSSLLPRLRWTLSASSLTAVMRLGKTGQSVHRTRMKERPKAACGAPPLSSAISSNKSKSSPPLLVTYRPASSAYSPAKRPATLMTKPKEESPDSPVSVNNAQVFKRPTVADLRRERAQMHDELNVWVGSLRSARAEFDGVIGEIEARMRVLKAVNRMQAPLRKAPLGRGRGRGRGR
jgi:hypothetical protein